MEKEDLFYMQRAIELAERGAGFVSPNPLVGAVIVREGRILAEGWHARYGEWHAERNALQRCDEDPVGATMYVTLEPCCHHGKTPPCTDAIIASRIVRVVVGLEDPNPLVAGKGIEQLRAAGVSVSVGVAEEQIREQNRIFLRYITGERPWIMMKTAMTLDGKIATWSGDSKWVTGPEARAEVHEMRARYMAIMVGIGTVLADDPLLNCRLEGRVVRQPVRIVVDSNARIPLQTQLVGTAKIYRTIVAHTCFADAERLRALRERGVETLCCDEVGGLVEVTDLARRLRKLGLDAVLLEGGASLNGAFVQAGLVDEVYAFIAPKLLGGERAKTPVAGVGFERMREALHLRVREVRTLGEDVLLKCSI